MSLKGKNFLIFGVVGKLYRSIDQLSHCDIAVASIFMLKMRQKVLIDIKGEKVVLDCQIYAPANLPSHSHISQAKGNTTMFPPQCQKSGKT